MEPLHVRSTAFGPGEAIPRRYTADGQNISPPLEWSSAPEGTDELAVIVDDPDVPQAEPFTHWLLYHIPPGTTTLAPGASGPGRDQLPTGTAPGRNSFRSTSYRGPAPPPGRSHRYHFAVYALDRRLDLKPGADRGALLRAMKGHVLARGDLVGVYER